MKSSIVLNVASTAALIALSAIAVLLGSEAAEAGRGGKGFYSQDYEFDRPMKGYEGTSGNYYCSYQRLPNRVCRVDGSGNEHCVIKGWTLRQMCQ